MFLTFVLFISVLFAFLAPPEYNHWGFVVFFFIALINWLFGPSKETINRRRKEKEIYLKEKYNIEI